jgi:hypothetical protein
MIVDGGPWDTTQKFVPPSFNEFYHGDNGIAELLKPKAVPQILLKCDRCGITWDVADTIVTWEEILEPGKGPAVKNVVRAAIRMESFKDGVMDYHCGVCGNEWVGKDPGPIDIPSDTAIKTPLSFDYDFSNYPAAIFHEGKDRPIGAVSYLSDEDKQSTDMDYEAGWATRNTECE